MDPSGHPFVASSDDCARSRSRSLRPWPRCYTTQPYGDRRKPGPGRRRAGSTTRPRSGRLLLPSRCSSACTKKSPAEGGLPAWQSRVGHRTGSAAHRGAHAGDVCACPVSRRSFGADGGPAAGRPQAHRHRGASEIVEEEEEEQQPRVVLESHFRDAAGREWCRVSCPARVYWWMIGTSSVRWTPPEGHTARPGRYTNTGRCGDSGG